MVQWVVGEVSNLGLRVVSSLVLAPVVIGAILWGGAAYAILVALLAVLAGIEWSKLVSGASDTVWPVWATALSLVLVVGAAEWLGAGTAVVISLAAGLFLFVGARISGLIQARMIALGVPYVGLAMAALVWLRDDTSGGAALVLWLCLCVWATDIGAYFAGRRIGGPRLAPVISPNKTWSGLAGGMATSAFVGGLVAVLLPGTIPWVALILGAVIAAVAQLGDLFESAVKRSMGAKDSGRIIPGHGGLLDRIDGIMAAAPFLAVFQVVLGGRLQWL